MKMPDEILDDVLARVRAKNTESLPIYWRHLWTFPQIDYWAPTLFAEGIEWEREPPRDGKRFEIGFRHPDGRHEWIIREEQL